MLQEQYSKNGNEPIDFLIRNMLKDEKEFIKKLVKYNKNIIVFFDGIDEITSNYETCMKFMKDLINLNAIKKMYITSQPNYVKKLQEIMNVLAYTINEFNPTQVEDYLCKYYKTYGDERVKIYVKELIKLLNDSPEHFSLIGNPLFLRITAIFFKKNHDNLKECDSVEEFVNGNNDKPEISINNINLYTLYEYYVMDLYYQYYKKKKMEMFCN